MSLLEQAVFREPEVTDAKRIVDFYNYVGGETTFLSFEKDEYPLNEEAQKEDIISTKEQPNSIMLLTEVNGEIVCIGTIHSTTKIKARHCGELGIVVAKEYQGQGIGTKMMKALLDWCRANDMITRVQLDTRTDNEKAVKLYKDLGFEIEGELKNSTLIDGKYYNLYIMGLML